ncbi:hypothetical protein [Thermomonospora cellulosilytica]|uniref:Uncharacterized protein n=1 Tax=Thermomonospora cellulosilytica TaxID=1411118 RepID=A0A7W3RBC0_9ACTN|nr:hypothetical protein [Thermomonospora cellulosilytica]MBA9006135.1 hypothetical protein [Thermomonospora cellulosilytica]
MIICRDRFFGAGAPFAEGHQEAMEYAAGLIALIGIAAGHPRR